LATLRQSLVVLAGGEGRRLGPLPAPKPLVRVGGVPVLERVVAAGADLDEVVVAVRDRPAFTVELHEIGWVLLGPENHVWDRLTTPQGIEVVLVEDIGPASTPELHAAAGPLVGLAAALAAAHGDICVAFGGDMPFVTQELVTALAAALTAKPTTDAVAVESGGRIHPLCAAYRRSAALAAARRLLGDRPNDTGRSPSLRALLAELPVARFTQSRIGRCVGGLGGDGGRPLSAALRGIDTPADLRWARAQASETPRTG